MSGVLVTTAAFFASPLISYAEVVTLTGAGATFPYPLYSKWFYEYNKLFPNVKINYQSIGSGGGIRQIMERTVDFGATDGFMTDEQLEKAPGILHIPMVAGADVVTYNLPGLPGGLRFTPEIIAGIFLGEITDWDDPRIQEVNPGVNFPKHKIIVVHRSDGSGTTAIWTHYLSAVSATWAKKVGAGTSVNWPTGLGGKGNEGVAGLVKQVPGSIGYVELAYAVQNKLPYGQVRNKAGKFVEPTLESITAAMAEAVKARKIPPDTRIYLVDAPGEKSYPIAGFTWLLVYEKQKDPVKGKVLVDFLRWAITEGQKYAPPLLYAPLAPEVVQLNMKIIEKIKVG
ncbi:MAG: phosphate ABC transporter substrate-binding protein PstS [bacterium]